MVSPPSPENDINEPIDNENIDDHVESGYLNPANIPPHTDVFFVLNEVGNSGARLRNAPSISQSTIIEIVWFDAVLEYLHQFVPDNEVRGLYWLRVRTPNGTDGYISSQLVTLYGSF